MTSKIFLNWGWLPMAILVIGVALLTRPAIPIDETRYLSVAWEMWQNGHFLVPHSNGLPYSHKPPLLFWLIHFSWWLAGVQQWSARCIAPLFGLAALALCRALTGRIFPAHPETQRLTPYILLGMLSWAVFSSLTMFDTLMSCAAVAGQFAVFLGAKGQARRWWLALGIAIGTGILAKGPVILVFVLPVAFLAPWWQRPLPGSISKWFGQTLLAIAIGSGIALAWALPAAWAGGSEYGHALLFGQTAGRMVNSFAHQQPSYWYLLILPAVIFPWSVWLPIWRNLFRSAESRPGIRFLLAILLPGLGILSLVSGKQVYYLLPLLPATAILLAAGAHQTMTAKNFDRRLFLTAFAIVAAAFVIIPFLPAKGSSAQVLNELPPWLGLCPLIAFLPFIMGGWRTPTITPIRMTVAMVLLLVGLHVATKATFDQNYNPTKITAALTEIDHRRQPIMVYPGKLDDQFHFAARLTSPVIALSTEKDLSAAAASEGKNLLIFTKKSVLPLLPANATSERFRGGWLVLLPPTPLAEPGLLDNLLKK